MENKDANTCHVLQESSKYGGAAAGKSCQPNVLTAVGTVRVGSPREVVAVEEQLWLQTRAGGGEVTESMLRDVGQAREVEIAQLWQSTSHR